MFLKFTKTAVGVLLLSAILVLFASVRFASFSARDAIFIWQGLFVTVQGFFFMFLGAVFIIRILWRENVRDFGLARPFREKKSFILTFFTVLLFGLLAFAGSFLPSVQNYYSVGASPFMQFFFLGILFPAIYYFSEEFLFRGFLFWGLWRNIGRHAFWVSSLLFALFHIGKPWIEIPFAFIAGLAFSYLSFKTKSFIPAAIVHFTTALVVNAFSAYLWLPSGGVTPLFRF